MSLIAHPLRRIGLASLLAIASHGSARRAGRTGFWPINEATISTGVTGEASEPLPVEQAPSAQEQMPAALAQATPDQQTETVPEGEVDESALRFFRAPGRHATARDRDLALACPLPGLDAAGRSLSRSLIRSTSAWKPSGTFIPRIALAEGAAGDCAAADGRTRLAAAGRSSRSAGSIGGTRAHRQRLRDQSVRYGHPRRDRQSRIADMCGKSTSCGGWPKHFARTDRQPRARDAYRYILDNCDDPPGETGHGAECRPASRSGVSRSIASTGAHGRRRHRRVRARARRACPPDRSRKAARIATLQVPAEQLNRLERLAEEEGQAADALLLGWHYLVREAHAEAEKWFRLGREEQDSADASEGLALALIARGQHVEAEDVIYPWRGRNRRNTQRASRSCRQSARRRTTAGPFQRDPCAHRRRGGRRQRRGDSAPAGLVCPRLGAA